MLLRRADVVDGALDLLSAEGLDRVTTRRLGAWLGVQGPALYRHFPNKEALLDAMADRIIEGVGDSLPNGFWDEQLTLIAHRLRDALLSHRDGARVVAGTYVAGPHTRLVENTILKVLQQAGLPARRAGWTAFALGHYVLGHTIEEEAQTALVDAGTWNERSAAMSDRLEDSYVREAVTEAFTADPAERFDHGLRLFLDGIREALSPSGPTTPLPNSQ